jgi:hypothetical protein
VRGEEDNSRATSPGSRQLRAKRGGSIVSCRGSTREKASNVLNVYTVHHMGSHLLSCKLIALNPGRASVSLGHVLHEFVRGVKKKSGKYPRDEGAWEGMTLITAQRAGNAVVQVPHADTEGMIQTSPRHGLGVLR